MNIDNLNQVIGSYITSNRPKYAILINGSWGTGKLIIKKKLLY